MSERYSEHFFEDRESLLAELKNHIVERLKRRIDSSKQASIALSGGSTPEPLYKLLRDVPLDWPKIQITLTDERVVSNDHPDSNEAMLRRTLFAGPAASASFIPLVHTPSAEQSAALQASQALRNLRLPLDILLLGMGNDMHTASLFPDAPELRSALDLEQKQPCIALCPASSEHPRLSLTLNTLLNSREIILLITGQEKIKTLRKAQTISNFELAPIAAIMHQSDVPVHIFWSP